MECHNSLPPKNPYDVVLGHMHLKVNSIQILKNLLAHQNGKSKMNIPLVCMVSLQVVFLPF